MKQKLLLIVLLSVLVVGIGSLEHQNSQTEPLSSGSSGIDPTLETIINPAHDPDMLLSVNKHIGNAINISVSSRSQGGGGEAIFTQTSTGWQEVWQGNGDLPCSTLDKYGVSHDIATLDPAYPGCYDDSVSLATSTVSAKLDHSPYVFPQFTSKKVSITFPGVGPEACSGIVDEKGGVHLTCGTQDILVSSTHFKSLDAVADGGSSTLVKQITFNGHQAASYYTVGKYADTDIFVSFPELTESPVMEFSYHNTHQPDDTSLSEKIIKTFTVEPNDAEGTIL